MSQTRLQKRVRLLNAADFKQVFDNPKRSSDKYFTVLARLNGKDYPRLGLAISKKNAKLAVSRNRIKRIIRESFRQTSELCNADIVVMTTRLGEQGSNQELYAALQKHWQTIQKKCVQS